MTENEAIEAIKHDLEWHSKELQPKYKEVLRFAIQALEEIQRYRALGTVEELEVCKEKEKQRINTWLNDIYDEVIDEFVDKIYIGKINEETNTRDIEIKWNFE